MNTAQDNYKNCTTVYSKQLYTGGRNFLKYNHNTMKYTTGNTASTAVSDHNSGVLINDVTSKELKNITASLDNLGYTRHDVKWNTGKDTYESIKEVGL